MSYLPSFENWKDLISRLLDTNKSLAEEIVKYHQIFNDLATWLKEQQKLPYMVKRDHMQIHIAEYQKKFGESSDSVYEVLSGLFGKIDVIPYMLSSTDEAIAKLTNAADEVLGTAVLETHKLEYDLEKNKKIK